MFGKKKIKAVGSAPVFNLSIIYRQQEEVDNVWTPCRQSSWQEVFMFEESSCQLHQYPVHECFPHREQSLYEANMAALSCSDQDKVGIRHGCLLGDCWERRYTGVIVIKNGPYGSHNMERFVFSP